MIESLYEGCGLLATYLGTLIEGEVMFLTSIVSAKLGLFNYYWALVAAFLGAYTQAWIKFLIVKKHGANLLAKKPALKLQLDKASSWFDKRPYAFLSVYKFMYGMSTIILLMSGLKNISYWRFGLHAAIGILLWVIVFGGLGYFCADLMISGIDNISKFKWHIIGSMIFIGLLVWFIKKRPINNECFVIAE